MQILVSMKKENSVLHNLNVLKRNNNQKLFSVLNLKSNKTSLDKKLVNNKDCEVKCKQSLVKEDWTNVIKNNLNNLGLARLSRL